MKLDKWLEELKRVERGCSPSPWSLGYGLCSMTIHAANHKSVALCAASKALKRRRPELVTIDLQNMDAIVALRNALPKLIAMVESAQAWADAAGVDELTESLHAILKGGAS